MPVTEKEKNMVKLTRARKSYKCYSCKSSIEKGDKYAKKSISIGSPNKVDYENRGGIPTMVMHGFRTTEPICQQCISK